MTASDRSCCSPARDPSAASHTNGLLSAGSGSYSATINAIPGGMALLGTADPQIPIDGEGPLRRKKIEPFRMSATTITNADFAAFVADTGYITEAEEFGWSFVFFSDLPNGEQGTQGVVGTEWWRKVDGANWKSPNGPGTKNAAQDHPVVQVSWKDAKTYALWCGGRLPTEAEWEHAARGGLDDARFPWGDREPDDEAYMPCNIWQGTFPNNNTGRDGFAHTAPAQSFEPNAYGLYNMVGNVWEWTAEPFRVKSLKKAAVQKMKSMQGFKLLKGGSFLCHKSYCYRYRIAARTGNAPDTGTPHQGFRVVWDAA